MYLLLSPLFASSALADHPVGEEIPDSVVVDVSGDAFDMLGALVAAAIPSTPVPIPPFAAGDTIGCIPFVGCTAEYSVSLSGAQILVGLDNLALTPATNALTLDVDITLYVNSSADPASLDLYADIFGIELINDQCDLYLDPIHVSLDAAIQLALVPDPAGIDLDGDGRSDTRRLDVTVPPATWNWDADDNDFNFGGCGTADVINTINQITSVFGLNLYDELLGLVEPEIDALVQDLPGLIEPELEGLVQDLVIDEELDLLGTPLRLTLWPSTVATAPATGASAGGLRLGMSSMLDVPTAACVAPYDTGGSFATPSNPPLIGTVGSVPFTPTATVWIDDDFVNHVLYAAWKGGLLCYDLSSDSADLPLPVPLDTGLLLTLLAGDQFDALFPVAVPMEISTDPQAPPTLDPGGPHDFDIDIEKLGLGFLTEIDGRKVRLVGLSLDGQVGADLSFDDTVGTVGVAVALDGDSFTPTVTANDYVPAATETIEGNFSTLFGTVVGPLLGSSLNLSFPLGTLEGIGVTQLGVDTAGANGDWTGAMAAVGVPTYPATGCDLSQGCDTSSCGCSQGGGAGNAIFVLLPLAVAARRRRR